MHYIPWMLTLAVACVYNQGKVLQSPTTPHLLVMFFIGPKSKRSASAVETSHLKMADSSHTEAFSACALVVFRLSVFHAMTVLRLSGLLKHILGALVTKS